MRLLQKMFKKQINKRAELIGKQMLSHIKDGQSILDFGCGDMVVSEFISSKRKVKITGIDVINYNCTDLKLVLYEGGKLPFKDNFFDVVFASFVLHHTNDPAFYLSELFRVSRGKIILMEDTFTNKYEKMATYLFDWITNHLESLRVKVPFNFLSVDEWKSIIKKEKISLVSIKRVYPNIVPFIPTRNVMMLMEK